jgi:Fe-S cluster biogenesis protein NfuA
VDSLADRVERALTTTLVPAMQDAGIELKLAGVDPDGVVRVQISGACPTCPSTTMLLIQGIERQLLELVPEVAYLEVTQG